ncbi:MAG: hypothetical protein ACK4R9_12595 [Ignavibacterium sp.]
MKNFVLTLLAIISFVSFSSFASNGQKNNFSIIEVITPSQEIYDSGMYRTLYKSFYIVDKDNQKVVSCGDVLDRAAKVKLFEGSYTIYYQDLQGNLNQKSINVENNTYIQLVLN